MGFSRTTCVSSYVQLDTIKVIGCNETGLMSSMSSYGIIPDNAVGWNTEGATYYNAYSWCGSSTTYPEINQCSPAFYGPEF